MNVVQILSEGVRMALQSLRANRLRSVLSLLGMTLGIFSIITIFAAVDSMSRSITDSIESVGSDVVYIQKWPWGSDGGEYQWWKFFQRPEPRYEELEKLRGRVPSAQYMAYLMAISGNLNYRNNITENVQLHGISHEYLDLWPFTIEKGRYFSLLESNNGRGVAILGHDVAIGLFGDSDPIGKEVRILGEKVRVIGTVEKEGSKLIGESHDELVLLPVTFMLRKVNENQMMGSAIMVKAWPGTTVDQLKDELKGKMRGIRRLRPRADDNFAMNEISVLQQGTEAIFGGIWLGGLVIGGFALLAGGFGIANIMFVSVSERIGQIGIQKALGARANFILYQFLAEATILSIIGGLIGLLLTQLAVWVANAMFEDFEVVLSSGNIVLGLTVSALIGALFGLIPAINASRKDPVEAIRTNI